MRRRSRTLPAAAALAGALLVSACGAGVGAGSSTPASYSAAGKAMTAAQVRAAGKVTLRLYDFETSGGLSPALNILIREFEHQFPNITIKRTSRDFNDYGKTIGLIMSSSSAPDLAETNVVMVRTLIPAHLVRNLDSYYHAYNWATQYPASVLPGLRSSNGKTFGHGPYWGQALGGNMVGVYYNKRMLASLGLKIPATFAQFEHDLAVARQKGELPIQLGNLDQYPANHVLSTVINDFNSPQAVRNWINGVPGSTFVSPGITQASQTLQQWAKAGYLPGNTNGTRYDAAIAAFGKGQGLFYITGSWEEPVIHQAMGNNAGFFLLPPKDAGGESYATGWLQNPFTISSKSRHADLAAYFLNFMSGPQGNKTAVAGGFLPFGKFTPTADQTENDVVAAWEQAARNNTLVPYLDSATPSMNTTLFPAIQSLIADKTTPTQFVRTVQGNWASYYG